MTKVNYAVMSDGDLKQYILSHRQDKEAFYAYMDRRQSRSSGSSIAFDDPNWEEKVLLAVKAQQS